MLLAGLSVPPALDCAKAMFVVAVNAVSSAKTNRLTIIIFCITPPSHRKIAVNRHYFQLSMVSRGFGQGNDGNDR
jgi:hypothetical protein